MIRKFGVRNFYCFKEGVEINFEFDGHVPASIKQDRDVTSILGIKGANGSGKTNIIKALSFLKGFCYFSADSDLESKMLFESFAKNTGSTEFYIDFEINGSKYYYELELTKEHVIREELYRKKSRKVLILKRELNNISFSIQELSEIETIKLRKNTSIISLFNKYNFESEMIDLKNINNFFFYVITNVNDKGYVDANLDLQYLLESYSSTTSLFDFVKEIVMIADEGIKNIEIKETVNEKGEKLYFSLFQHKTMEGKDFFLTLNEESSGTKRLFEKMTWYWTVLASGGLLAIDEFDIHLHAMVLPKILDLFLNKESNPNGAQFIFTAHNTEIIDCLGKYRTILVNKEDNESYCYRLDEITGSMIRNDRPITPLYLDGKIGGIPSNISDNKGVEIHGTI
ncbi:MAG: AAA family ATPase [Methylococcaceae bacterium]|nr:AAA family ATPase [Methylococcaceae bacterium]